jgi:hypothetical protein
VRIPVARIGFSTGKTTIHNPNAIFWNHTQNVITKFSIMPLPKIYETFTPIPLTDIYPIQQLNLMVSLLTQNNLLVKLTTVESIGKSILPMVG